MFSVPTLPNSSSGLIPVTRPAISVSPVRGSPAYFCAPISRECPICPSKPGPCGACNPAMPGINDGATAIPRGWPGRDVSSVASRNAGRFRSNAPIADSLSDGSGCILRYYWPKVIPVSGPGLVGF